MPARGYALVVGAGFAGSVVARELAEAGRRVVVIDSREHIGGNAYDETDPHGLLVHRYGPHIFHTGSKRVFDYLSRFTDWWPYQHRVMACVDGRLLPFPINRTTINSLYGLDLDEAGMEAFLARVREHRHPVRTSEDVVLNAVGRELYEMFFRHYTLKHWGLDAAELSASVAARIPVRTNGEDRYFSDAYQAMPALGYTELFRNLLDHPSIRLELGMDYFRHKTAQAPWHVVFTGPVDAYYRYSHGKLPYRSLRFQHQHHAEVKQYQPVAVVNYPDESPHTRVTEFKHLTGQAHPGTSIVYEFSRAHGDPYYPIPTAANERQYQRYKAYAAKETQVSFVGRLAQYRYYNMDQVVGAALALSRRLTGG